MLPRLFSSLSHRTRTAALRRIRRKRSVVLGYHGVADCARKDDLFLLQVTPARFRSLLESMLEAGFRFLTLAEFVRESRGGTPPPGLAVVSFDDAMRNNLTTALPILRELGIPATVYVPTDWLGGQSPYIGPGGDGAILTAEELLELAAAGWELGGHTLSHADLSMLGYDEARREIEGGCTALAQLTGEPVQTFAYPFGRYGPVAIAAVRDVGLSAAVTTGSGTWDRFELTRAMVGAADPFPILLLKLTDRYEPLLRSAPMRLVRRITKELRGKLNERRHALDAERSRP
jgi:peptidoglycan/xylan/chitin deacetylase (PgdA/CDA1 family)